MRDEDKDKCEMKTSLHKGQFVPPERGPDEVHYSNVASVTANLYDLRMDFGQRSLQEENPHHPDITVLMSPQHAKELLVLLIRSLGEYERQFGTIPSEYKVSATVERVERGESPFLFNQKIDDLDN